MIRQSGGILHLSNSPGRQPYTITGQFLVILTRFFATEPTEYLEFFKIFLLCVLGGYLHLVAAGGRRCPQVVDARRS